MSETLSLELSKRLDELGVKVESEYCWWKWLVDDVVKDNCPEYPSSVRLKRNMKDESFFKERSAILAPTFEEIWAVMPEEITIEGYPHRPLSLRLMKDYGFTVAGYFYMTIFEKQMHESPTEALGLLAIWLAEHGHLI